MAYRPWGPTNWLLEKLGTPTYSVFGCLGPEKRSAASLGNLISRAEAFTLVKLFDIEPIDAEAERSALDASEAAFQETWGKSYFCAESRLDASLDDIDSTIEEAVSKSKDIILDISSMPKRWFFYIVRQLYLNAEVRNLICVYTSGSKYAATLSENPEAMRALPGFAATIEQVEYEYAFIGIGFQALSMFPLFGDRRTKHVHMLFPFPPGPPGISKNWEFVEQLERQVATDSPPPTHKDRIVFDQVSAHDVSQAFDAMISITDHANHPALLAPYGPKPISLAMCLFALAADEANKSDVPAFYTQPKRYDLNYTKNAALTESGIETWAYALKLDGKQLYSV